MLTDRIPTRIRIDIKFNRNKRIICRIQWLLISCEAKAATFSLYLAPFLLSIFLFTSAFLPFTSAATCHVDDESGLLAFKSGITSDPSGLLTSWKKGTDCCTTWNGVSCDQDNRVNSLSIYGDPGSPKIGTSQRSDHCIFLNMAEEAKAKLWEGKVSAKLRGPKAETIWSFLEDFCSLDKWLPGIDTCYKVEGVDGQPGLIRYCGTTITSPSNEPITLWCHEKLVEIDEAQRMLSYEITENNMGMNMYKATIKVVAMEGGDGESSCEIKWSFVAEPVESFKFEEFVGYIESSLHGMAERMENVLQSTN